LIVVDSSALVAILRREPEADAFLRTIAEVDGCLVSAVSFLETSLVLAGRHGDGDAWAELDALISAAGIDVVPHDATLSKAARATFLRYGKGRHPAGLNLGDCGVYALAKSRGLALLFKGEDFSRTDVEVVA
jgi:ribonuclease VapC